MTTVNSIANSITNSTTNVNIDSMVTREVTKSLVNGSDTDFIKDLTESCKGIEKSDGKQDNKVKEYDGSNLSKSADDGKTEINENPQQGRNDSTNSLPQRLSSVLDSESEEDTFVLSRKKVSEVDNNSESQVSDNVQVGKSNKKVSKHKRVRRLAASDSEEDVPINRDDDNNTHDLNDTEEDSKEENNKSKRVSKSRIVRKITDNDSDDDSTNGIKDFNLRFQTLVDSESEEDDHQRTNGSLVKQNMEDEPTQKSTKKKKEPKRKGSIRASKDEAMKQIHSETQRLIRESHISLPYHRPKQRTLQEFLNRKKVSSALPRVPNTAAKLKMSSEIVSKVLEEKEKEAELFYKSSDSEDDTAKPVIDRKHESTCSKNEQPVLNSNEDISIEETQKLLKNIQDSHNKKEIIQQGCLDLGVPRKLFIDYFNEEEKENMDISPLNTVDTNETDMEQKQKSKEYKQGLKDVSVPRKLFDEDFEENMDVEFEDINTASDILTAENDAKRDCTDKEIIKKTINVLITTTENQISDNGKEIESCPDSSKQNSSKEDQNQLPQTNTMVISETPHISNKEISKTLQKERQSLSNITDSMDTLNSKEDENQSNAETVDVLCRSDSNQNFKIQEEELKKNASPLSEINDDKLLITKKKVLSNIPSLKPTLKGSPGMVIDLSDDVKPTRTGVNSLIDRFLIKHTTVKHANNKSEVTTVSEEANSKTQLLNDDHELNKPGAKLQRLREDLKLKMALKRNEEWKQKEQDMKEDDDDLDEFESKCELIDKEMEGEKCEELTETEESEPEEDDMPIKEKKYKKSAFADDEAEVSEDDGQELSNDELNGEDEDDGDDEEDENDEDSDEDGKENKTDSEGDESDTCPDDTNKPKKLRRIISAFEDDSNLTSTKDSADETKETKKDKLSRTETDVDIFATDNDSEAWTGENKIDMPVFPSQIQTDPESQTCKTPLSKMNIFNFISPITQLTALNTRSESEKKDSAKKMSFSLTDESESFSAENTPTEKISQNVCPSEKKGTFQKKLFDDAVGEMNDEELLQLCSGTFPSTQKTDTGSVKLKNLCAEEKVTESQLLNMCSGIFSTQSDIKNLENDTLPVNEITQDVKSISEKKSVSNTTPWNNLAILSSDEDNDEPDDTNNIKKKKKRKPKKLELSDDEEETVDQSESEEEAEITENEEEKYVDYDSEENEIVVVPKKEIKKVAATFLEEEAELSESDWDSADEDEKDLDKLELEEGDDEDIDENQLKKQLGKIHMRQVLDEDQRKVRLLKELLLEDGDLHSDSSGRERKFRWRNIDKLGSFGDSETPTDGEGWMDFPENEDEAEWRKFRHERDKFLEEKMKSIDEEIENDLKNSQIFKVGMKVLQKTRSTESQSQETDASETSTKPLDPIVPRTMSDLLESSFLVGKSRAIHNAMQRHSLLARGEASLARIALIARQSEPSMMHVNKRNFVFTHVNPLPKEESETTDKTKEAEEIDLSDKPRKRKAMTGVTPRTTKKARVENPFTKGRKF